MHGFLTPWRRPQAPPDFFHRSCLRALLAGLVLVLPLAGPAHAQQPAAARHTVTPDGSARRILAPDGTPRLIQLAAGQQLAASTGSQVLRQQLALTADDDLRSLRTETDELGFVHERYQQYYRGVKVEHGTYTTHSRSGRIETLSGEIKRPANLSVQPVLNEAAARQRALAHVGATRYMWQNAAEEAHLKQETANPNASYFPTGELVIVGDHRQAAARRPLTLAWKFNVYAQQPLSREWIYVAANTGEVVLADAIIKHTNATGTFATRYSGSRTATTDLNAGVYRLRETGRGSGINTYNCQQGTDYAAAIDFTDANNNWTAAEFDNANKDNAALDAHYGAEATYDYFFNVHGRNSYDNAGAAINSYVHFLVGYDNAFWDGQRMTYGDGSTYFSPLTSLDVCAHEIGHAVCENTAGLIYENESGALNEGFSDIWGAAVEYYKDPTKQTWLIGEEIALTSPSLRSMSDPNAEGQPDTYLGTNWQPTTTTPDDTNDYGGVHINSGVINYWFYLLSVGGSSTNDNGDPYTVAAQTIQKAALISYRAERLYLTSGATYDDARTATLQAATDLYGANSAELAAVANAWHAVGVGAAAPVITAFTPTSGPVGETVIISGAGLVDVTDVTFNGLSTSGHSWISDGMTVEALVPAGATTGLVRVVTSGGTAVSATNYTITSSGPAPTITSYSPAGGQTLGGSLTITGTNLTAASAVRINGVAATILTNTATQITTTVPAGITVASGTVKVTTTGGIATSGAFSVRPAVSSFTPTSGYPGVPVILTGTGFLSVSSVKFNNTTASYTVNAAGTSITTTVPTGATTGTVSVTNTITGTSATSFTVTAPPVPTVTTFTPTTGGPNSTVTVTGTGFHNTTAVRFGGVAAGSFTVVSGTSISVMVPIGAVTGPISVVTPGGTGTSAGTFTVTAPVCALAVSVIPTAPVSCGNQEYLQAVPTGVSQQQGYNVASIAYAPLTGTGTAVALSDDQVSGALPIGFSFSFFGATYTDFYISSNGNIQFGASPSTSYSVSAVPSTNLLNFVALCWRDLNPSNGGTIEYLTTGTAPNRKLVVTYSGVPFFGGGGSVSGQIILLEGANQIELHNTSISYAYAVQGVNNADGSQGVAVPGRNAESWEATADAWRFTYGSSAGPVTYSWSPATGLSSTTGASVYANPTVPTTYTVTATDLLCSRTATVTVATSVPNVTATGGSNCGTGPVTLTAAGTLAGGSYRWYTAATGGTFISGATAASYTTPSLSATTTYYVAGVSSAGVCESTTRTAVTATINAVPAAPTTTGASRCGTGTVVLTAAGTPTGGSYRWYTVSTGGTAISGATAATYTTGSLSATTTYYVSTMSSTLCASAARTAIVATINAVPAAPTATGGSRCGTGTVVLTAAGAPTGGSYRWYTVSTGGTAISGATTASYTTPSLTATTTYYVTTMSSALCESATRTTAVATINAVPAAPAVTAASRCDAGTVTFAAATGAPTGGSYKWYAALTGGTALVSTAAYTTPSLTVTTTYYVTAVSTAGCESTPRTAVTATINTTATPTASASATTISLGQTVTLSVTQVAGVTYAWTGPNLAATTGASVTATPATAGTATYAVTATTTATGCASAAAGSVSVTVNATASPTITALAPTRNARAAARTANLSLTFSTAMSAATASGTALKVFGSQTAKRAGAYSGGGTAVVGFDPTADFKPGETMSATITTAAQSTGGGAVARGQVWQWTAAAAAGPATFMGTANPAVGALARASALADVDGDGDLDLLSVIGAAAGSVSIRFNDGAGTYSGTGTVAVSGGPRSLAVGDVDGDGDVDLLTANATAGVNTVSVRTNDGAGTFSGSQNVAVSTTPVDVKLADVDADGDLDLLAANYGTTTVSIRLNDGTGVFAVTGQNVAVGAAPFGLAVGDVDNDGDIDLLATNYAAVGTLAIRLNDGTGIFGGTGSVAVGTNPTNVTLADVDGDGDLDALASNYGTTTVSVRINDGAGAFSGTQNVAVGATPYTVTTGDLDGDGDLDLVVPNYSANTLAVRLNDGLGIFSGSGTVATGTNPIHAVLGDVDGDGDLDAAITNYTSGTVSIRLNQAAVAAPTLTSVAPTSGPVGTPVTLTGTSLTGATGVSFGGIALTGSSFTVVNATTLTLNVPAGAATGSVTVTTAGGTTAAQTFTVTVVTGLALAADANVAGLPGAQVLVPVRATGFSGLMGLQGSLTFDASQLTYVGVEGFAFADLDAGDFGAAQAATGTLTLAWANSQAVAPAALAAGAQLFAVRFTVNAAAAGSTALTLPITLAASPLAWQAVRSDYSLLTPTLTNGSVAVAAGVVVSGTVLTSGGAAVAGATVRASGPTVARPTTTTAAGTGAWSLSVPGTGAYVVAPRKTNDVNLTNGLSVLDVLLIQRHVLASPLLGNAYKVIAADVDSSGTVTVADVAQVRDLLLGTRTSFGATGAPGRLWRFVASSQTFANANSPWPIQTSRSYASVSAQAAQNFVGCKLGDVSGDWNPALPRPAAPLSAVALRTDAATVVPGGRVRVAVRTAQAVTLTGAQATLTWNPAVLRLVVARPAPATGAGSSAALTPTFGLTRTAQGELRVIWTATDAQAHPLAGGAAVVELEFEGIGLPGATTALALAAAAGTNGELAPVATDDALALHPLTLAGAPITLDRVSGMAPDQAAGLHLTLWPNPAHETVRITGVSAAPVQLLDGVGRVVRSVTATDAGAATLDVRGLAAGVYVVRSGARTQRLVVE